MTSSTQTSASNKPVVADEYSARPVFWNSERLSLLMLVFYATLFVVVLILPLGILISRSFTDRNENWVGVTNYTTYFASPERYTSLSNSIFVSSLTALIVTFLDRKSVV